MKNAGSPSSVLTVSACSSRRTQIGRVFLAWNHSPAPLTSLRIASLVFGIGLSACFELPHPSAPIATEMKNTVTIFVVFAEERYGILSQPVMKCGNNHSSSILSCRRRAFW